MKIAISSNTAWSIYNFRASLIKKLVSLGYEVVVVCPKDRYAEKLSNIGCMVYDIGIDNKGINPINDLWTLVKFYQCYQIVSADLVMQFTIKPVIYGTFAARLLRIPVINTITGLGTAFISGKLLKKMVKILYFLALRYSAKVFFQNRDDHAEIVGQGLVKDRDSVIVSGSGIDLNYFSPWPSVGHNNNATVFLFIGRLLRDKGIREFAEAARNIKREIPLAEFRVLGPMGSQNRTGIGREEIKVWGKDGFVEYLGETDDVRPYIAEADCVVLPSYREGLPRSLLEAAAMERPVIATNVPGCRDVVLDGVSGFTCKVRSVEDLEKKMSVFCRMSSCEKEKMGKEGRRLVESKFSENTVIATYIKSIQEIGRL